MDILTPLRKLEELFRFKSYMNIIMEDKLMRTDEIALVKVAVKRAKKKNSVDEGFKAIYRWKKNHPNRILDDILHCYRKVIKRGIIKDDVMYCFARKNN